MIEEKVMKYMSDAMKLIEVTPKSIAGASERAGKFLIICMKLGVLLMEREITQAKLEALHDIELHRTMANTKEKTITEKKIACMSVKSYYDAFINLKTCKSECKLIKLNISLLENAHILYRRFVGQD